MHAHLYTRLLILLSKLKMDTTAQVTFLTRKGDIQIGIYAKELPDVCRAFLEKCATKQYIGLRFGAVKDKVLQTVLPENDRGKIKPQFHSRLGFGSRGAVGLMACEDEATLDGLFITLEPATEFNGAYSLLGKVIGSSIYTIIDIADGEKSGDDLVDAIEVTNVQIDVPYFEDLKIDNGGDAKPKLETQQPKRRKKAVKLDYGDDDDDEKATGVFKIGAAHDTIRGSGTVNAVEKDSKTTEKKNKEENEDSNALQNAQQAEPESNDHSAGPSSIDGERNATYKSADLKPEIALSPKKEQSQILETKVDEQDLRDQDGANQEREEERREPKSPGLDHGNKTPVTEESGPLREEAVKSNAKPLLPAKLDPVLDIEDNVTKLQLLSHRFVPKAL